ncbi:type VI secretion system membrane subunit TssM, partial [Erwinia sp. MYb416]
LWGLVGVTALSALIWMVGPLLPFTRFQSLDSPLNRQLLIGLSYFLWILFQLIPQLYRAWFNSKLLTRLQLNNIDHAELQATGEMLNNRFSEAAMLLKKTQFG